ncbi:MAG: divalent metal cation transporter [Actinomycetota bacterium]|nr:divalent metal cation transporter [Actinomycetota bacterium]
MSEEKRSSEFLRYASIVGPGIITALAGVGASGITTCSVVGARFGLSMVWLLVVSAICLGLFQEMSARMGVVTGKGLAGLIRERFGLRPTFFAMVVLLAANLGTTVAEFAGIAASLEIFGINKYFTVPVVALTMWALVVEGSFQRVEKAFMLICLTQVSYFFSAFLSHPDWGMVATSLVKPTVRMESPFLYSGVALVGTTLAPWMQFFVQSNVVDKNIKPLDLKYERADVFSGVFLANVVALSIIICTTFTLHRAGIGVDNVQQAALALKPLAGSYSSILFGIGLFGASVLSANVVPLSTSYSVCEAFGWESGIGKGFSQARLFFGIYSFQLLVSVCIVLLPKVSLVGIILLTQVLNGILLPIILIYMLLIASDERIMGNKKNNVVENTIAYMASMGILLLNVMLFVEGLRAL